MKQVIGECRRLQPAELDAAVEVEARAFAEDPLWVYLIPDADRRMVYLRRFNRPFFKAAMAAGRVYGIGNPPAGVAIWVKPGEANPGFIDLVRAGFLRQLLSPFALSFVKAAPIFSKFDEFRERYATGPHYYLSTIGVVPEAQGRGLASRLIRPFLDAADGEDVGSYTETMTPSNVPLYEHYGFRCEVEYNVPGTDLRLWSFYRPPVAFRQTGNSAGGHTGEM